MGLFDFFKPKPQRELNDFVKQAMQDMFPRGGDQLEAELKRLSQRLGNYHSTERLKSTYIRAASSFMLNENITESSFVEKVLRRPDSFLNRREAQQLYEFLNEKFMRQSIEEKGGDVLVGLMDGLLSVNDGEQSDQLSNAYGSFGYDTSNPIPVKGIMSSAIYLGRLRTLDEQPVTWERFGSFSSEVSPHPVDGYRIWSASGTELKMLFISSYRAFL